jgi:hypothetical protein
MVATNKVFFLCTTGGHVLFNPPWSDTHKDIQERTYYKTDHPAPEERKH